MEEVGDAWTSNSSDPNLRLYLAIRLQINAIIRGLPSYFQNLELFA